MTNTGKPAEGLSADDFQVLDDGRVQSVRVIEQDFERPLPVHAVIVLQNNESGGAVLAKVRGMASVISNYLAGDMGNGTPSLAALLTVSDEVQLRQDFTADPNRLSDAFAKLSGSGESGRVLDGVSMACDLLAGRPEPARRVIVVISESRDRQSKADFRDVLLKAQRDEVVIYTISYSAYTTAFTQKASDRPRPPEQPGLYNPEAHGGGVNLLALGAELARLGKLNIADALAQGSGGGHETFTSRRGLESDLIRIGTEFHSRYTLTFVPPDSETDGYHRLLVSVHSREALHVHAKAGYWKISDEPSASR